MSSLLLVSYSHKIVDYKRKKEAKKEKVVIVAYLLIISNTNLKDTTMPLWKRAACQQKIKTIGLSK